MCTILTISTEFYREHADAVTARITEDARNNRDGWALMAYGGAGGPFLLRTMSIGDVLALVPWLFDTGHERIWLHARYATTGYKGLNGTHAFAAGDWNVMHNGSLTARASHAYRVDSELIGVLIDEMGEEAASAHLLRTERFLNCLIINNQSGAYRVLRSAHGSLYTDGQGNYSTGPLEGMGLPVLPGTNVLHGEVPDAPDALGSDYPPDYSPAMSDDSFIDWLISAGYDTEDLPDSIYSRLPSRQRDIYRDLILDTLYPKLGGAL